MTDQEKLKPIDLGFPKTLDAKICNLLMHFFDCRPSDAIDYFEQLKKMVEIQNKECIGVDDNGPVYSKD